MKLLLDQNLSFRLVALLATEFPQSAHVRDVGLEAADDVAIWQYAKQHGYAIVSKDDDFHQRSFVYGHPPKVVWRRLGNCTTDEIADALRRNVANLATFEADPQAAFVALS